MSKIMTKGALKLMARFLVSCCHPYIQPMIGAIEHEKILVTHAKHPKNVEIDELLKEIGVAFHPMYEKLSGLATRMRRKYVDEDVILYNFGGNEHIEKVLSDIAADDVKDFMPLKAQSTFLFQHLLGTMTVTDIYRENDRMLVVGRYTNNSVAINVKGLVVFREDEGEIARGKEIASHFATVIKPYMNGQIKALIRDEQSRNNDFLSMLQLLDGKTIELNSVTDMVIKTMNKYQI